MPILATIAAGFGSFILAVFACVKLHELLEHRWSDKRIDAVSAILCVLLTGTSAYVMAMFGPISLLSAALIHLGVGVFYTLIVATRFMNYIEAFVLATIMCILCTLTVLFVSDIREYQRETSINRSPNMVFTLGASAHLGRWATGHGFGRIFRSSDIVRFVQGGVVKTFRYPTTQRRRLSPMALDDESKQLLADLIDELRSAIPEAFNSLSDEFPDLCGFAIGTTVYIEFVAPICQSSSELPDGEQSCWERFSPPEWDMMNDRDRNDTLGDGVERARNALYEHCSESDGGTSYEIRMAYLDALLSLFVELESDTKFGAKTDERFLAIWIPDNSGRLIKSSEKLNTKVTHKRLLEHVR